jgi:hypothetical protein
MMRRRPLNCRLYYDCTLAEGERPPGIGDVLASCGKRGIGTIYLILGVRQAKRRDPARPPRFYLNCQRVPPENAAGLKIRWRLWWYPRNRRRPDPQRVWQNLGSTPRP